MKTKIVYVTGNVLDAPQPVIIHQVNCQGVMGSGVAKAIKESYPIVYQSYRWLYNQVENKKDLLGECQFVDVSENRTIVNMFSQFEYLPRTKRHTSYEGIWQFYPHFFHQPLVTRVCLHPAVQFRF